MILLNEVSCGEVRIYCRFCSKPLYKSRLHARCIFQYYLEQSQKVFVLGSVKTSACNIKYFNTESFAANKDKVCAQCCVNIYAVLRKLS